MPTPFAQTASTRSAASPGGSRPGHGSLGWLGLGSPPDTPAEQFASWLPYSAYLADEKLFVNRDSLGFMLELMPQSGADDRMAEVLISLYSTCPPATGIQFTCSHRRTSASSCGATPTCASRMPTRPTRPSTGVARRATTTCSTALRGSGWGTCCTARSSR